MKDGAHRRRLPAAIAELMRWGTIIGSILVGAATVGTTVNASWAVPVAVADVSVFVMLPVIRVVMMLAAYASAMDVLYVWITTALLVLLAAATVVGLLVS
ncbi:DUF1634 domain-containing protein [Agromyces subbeticus]|uniref:DUF1634 domain-containing protein n=1 Tax=Agromyces subbeticus TaxID=293890 RepID=UPI0003B36A70|nr:DUF1634 domain-containing protein [Agromyces subbeticus]